MKVYELLLEAPEDRIEYLAKTMGSKLISAAEKDHSLGSSAKDPAKIAAMLAEFDPTKTNKLCPGSPSSIRSGHSSLRIRIK